MESGDTSGIQSRMDTGRPSMDTFKTPIPKCAAYSKTMPLGFRTTMSYVTFTPQTTLGQNVTQGEYIQIYITGKEGYLLPDTTMLNIVVSVDQNPQIKDEVSGRSNLNFILQVDGSIMNIWEMIYLFHPITGELERYQQADLLFNLLMDMKYNAQEKQQQLTYGSNSISSDTMQFQSNMSSQNQNGGTTQMMNWNPRCSYNSVNVGGQGSLSLSIQMGQTQFDSTQGGINPINGPTYQSAYTTLPLVFYQQYVGLPSYIPIISTTLSTLTQFIYYAPSLAGGSTGACQLSWLSLPTPLYNGIQSGISSSIVASTQQTTVVFSKPFLQAPNVFLSLSTTGSTLGLSTFNPYAYIVSVSTTGFVWQAYTNSSVVNLVNCQINWFAVPTDSTSIPLGIQTNSSVYNVSVANGQSAVTFPKSFLHPPIVLLQASNGFANGSVPFNTFLVSVTNTGFIYNSDTTGALDANITYIAIPSVSEQNGQSTYVQTASCATIMTTMDQTMTPQDATIQSNQGSSIYGIPGSIGTTQPLINPNQSTGIPLGGPVDPKKVGFGFQKPFSPSFSQGNEVKFCGKPLIQCLQNGIPSTQAVLTRQFRPPLPSCLMGWLYCGNKILPMSALDQVYFQLYPSIFWLFASTPSQYAQEARTYRFIRCEIMCWIVKINDCVTNEAIQSQLACDGMWIKTKSYLFGSPTSVLPGQSAPTAPQIAQNFLSLIGIIFAFFPDDYKMSILARKNFRISMNLSSMQLNIDGTLWPDTTPVLGNSGNNTTYPNNNEFYYHLVRLFKKTTHNIGEISINPANFSLNQRGWNPQEMVTINNTQQQLYNIPGPYDEKATILSTQTLTNDLAFYFENSYIGKCAYGLLMEGLESNGAFLSGWDTTCVKNMVLNLASTQGNNFPRPSQMNLWYYFDVLFLLHKGRIRRIYC